MKIRVTRTKMSHDEFQRQIDKRIIGQFKRSETSEDERFWLALLALILLIIPALFVLMNVLVNTFKGYGAVMYIIIVVITIYQWGRFIERKD